jgi:hypothetical protein
MSRASTSLLSLLLIFSSAGPAWAWGRTGHRVISRLAERHLTDRTKAEIKALLEPGESLADCSTWADEVRGKMRHTAPWHYIDIPLDEPRYDDRFAADDARHGYIVPKIRELRATLKDRSKSVEERRFALRFLVHLVQDLHMPMHVGDNRDRGGGACQVRFFRCGTGRHRAGHTFLIGQWSRDEGRWLAELVAINKLLDRAMAMDGTAEDCATESLLAAREAYQDPTTGRRIKPGAIPG